jgi:hypothetical protein
VADKIDQGDLVFGSVWRLELDVFFTIAFSLSIRGLLHVQERIDIEQRQGELAQGLLPEEF